MLDGIDTQSINTCFIDKPLDPVLQFGCYRRVALVEVVKSSNIIILDLILIAIVLNIAVVVIPVVSIKWCLGRTPVGAEIAGMVGDHIEHDIHAFGMGLINQCFEERHTPKMPVNTIEIVGPIPMIGVDMALHLHRRDPDRCEPHAFNIIQLIDDTLEIAAMPLIGYCAVAGEPSIVIVTCISVGKAIRHDEIDRLACPVGFTKGMGLWWGKGT